MGIQVLRLEAHLLQLWSGKPPHPFILLSTDWTLQPMIGGSITSEPDFSPTIDATFVSQGSDYIHNDPSGKQMRLNAHAVLKYAVLNYWQGYVELT